ncbi:hypothetical protein U729_3100 (plasmid) [Clostridium baratii str. Sullivan]|uniref:Uncharacterized protein n=1 Tax=Clostridium baratii str. Sullivan TaxID=1415775 RepID=A0A0A7G2C8_9CLOT|nr:hypothetical protein [Clostridium baratii]AIY85205.1 hypothetical protein U729_3100 [Clostridium baratii str. Sullivan]
MKGKVTENIREYMNSMSKRNFSYLQVSAIANAIKEEYYDRKKLGIIIKTKTKEGREELNKRAADIANRKLNIKNITKDDVRLYKKCLAEEYTNRTGKCAWGFKELRSRLGYDPETALEIRC